MAPGAQGTDGHRADAAGARAREAIERDDELGARATEFGAAVLMGTLSPALELLRSLVARLRGGGTDTADGAATAAQVDTKLQGVLRALARAVGQDDALYMVHSALFAAWEPVAEHGACAALLS